MPVRSSAQTPRRPVVRRWQYAVACALLCTLAARSAAAQAPQAEYRTPAAVKYGKWAAATLAVGFTAFGIQAHNRADADFRSLADYCRTSASCQIGADGRYVDPVAESRYWDVVHGDRLSRALLVTGQLNLIAGVALFVIELKHGRGPQNIPYSPLIVEPGPVGTRIGLSFRVGAWSRR